LGNNSLQGQFPPSWFRFDFLPSLQFVSLPKNQLTGPLPSFPSATLVELNDNFFTGSIPSDISWNTGLEYLELTNNLLTGTIPISLGSVYRKVQYLNLGWNRLTGSIPNRFGGMTQLQTLSLHDNRLVGKLPEILGALTMLERLWMQNNSFSGNVPSSLSLLADLEELMLDHNRMTGVVPSEFVLLSSLRVLRLHNNNLSGELPQGICDLISTFIGTNETFQNPTVDCEEVRCVCCDCYTDETGLVPPPTSAPIDEEGDDNLAGYVKEMQALFDLHRATQGYYWTNATGWLQSRRICCFFGVTCDSDNTTVLGLRLGTIYHCCYCRTITPHSSSLLNCYLLSSLCSGQQPSRDAPYYDWFYDQSGRAGP
jgi:hypothetical protein